MRRRSTADDDASGTRTAKHRLPAALAPADAVTVPVPVRRGSTAPCERAVDARLVAEASIRAERIGRKKKEKELETPSRRFEKKKGKKMMQTLISCKKIYQPQTTSFPFPIFFIFFYYYLKLLLLPRVHEQVPVPRRPPDPQVFVEVGDFEKSGTRRRRRAVDVALPFSSLEASPASSSAQNSRRKPRHGIQSFAHGHPGLSQRARQQRAPLHAGGDGPDREGEERRRVVAVVAVVVFVVGGAAVVGVF